MDITFSIPHVFYPGSDQDENAYALRALLDCLVRLNRGYLRSHSVPTLYRSGVRFGRTKEWDSIPALYAKKVGDCKSLSAALIAEYLEQGIPCRPGFRWIPGSNGQMLYHILVQTANGWEDPSKKLGMLDGGRNENDWFGIHPNQLRR